MPVESSCTFFGRPTAALTIAPLTTASTSTSTSTATAVATTAAAVATAAAAVRSATLATICHA